MKTVFATGSLREQRLLFMAAEAPQQEPGSAPEGAKVEISKDADAAVAARERVEKAGADAKAEADRAAGAGAIAGVGRDALRWVSNKAHDIKQSMPEGSVLDGVAGVVRDTTESGQKGLDRVAQEQQDRAASARDVQRSADRALGKIEGYEPTPAEQETMSSLAQALKSNDQKGVEAAIASLNVTYNGALDDRATMAFIAQINRAITNAGVQGVEVAADTQSRTLVLRGPGVKKSESPAPTVATTPDKPAPSGSPEGKRTETLDAESQKTLQTYLDSYEDKAKSKESTDALNALRQAYDKVPDAKKKAFAEACTAQAKAAGKTVEFMSSQVGTRHILLPTFPTTKPASPDKPAVKPADKPADKPAVKPADKPAEGAKEAEPKTKGEKIQQDLQKALDRMNDPNNKDKFGPMLAAIGAIAMYIKAALNGTLEDPLKKPEAKDEKPGAKPDAKPGDNPADKPGEKKPDGKPGDKPADKPDEKKGKTPESAAERRAALTREISERSVKTNKPFGEIIAQMRGEAQTELVDNARARETNNAEISSKQATVASISERLAFYQGEKARTTGDANQRGTFDSAVRQIQDLTEQLDLNTRQLTRMQEQAKTLRDQRDVIMEKIDMLGGMDKGIAKSSADLNRILEDPRNSGAITIRDGRIVINISRLDPATVEELKRILHDPAVVGAIRDGGYDSSFEGGDSDFGPGSSSSGFDFDAGDNRSHGERAIDALGGMVGSAIEFVDESGKAVEGFIDSLFGPSTILTETR